MDALSWMILWCALLMYALWPLYVFTMAMLRAKVDGKTNVFAWILAAPIVFTALALDIALNYTLFALLTWDFPKRGEWTFSQRLNRLVREGGWRGAIGNWLAEVLLDPYDPDPNGHIKK